jgi:nucleotide-binding universal stress UspA family protein
MFRRILVPLDGSELAEQVLPYVKMLAKPERVPVTLLRVVEPLSYRVTAASQGIPYEQVNARMQAHSREYLEKVGDSLKEQGMPVLVKVLEGPAAGCIIQEGSQEPGALIAVSTHGRSGVARWTFGSVTDKVLQATTNPLLIIRSRHGSTPQDAVAIKSIIVPLDGSELAEQVLPHVAHLSRTLDLNVILLRVNPSSEDYRRYMDYLIPEHDDLLEHLDAQALEYLEEQGRQLRRQGVSKVEERLLHGLPAIAIADFAKEVPDNLMAMTTHGRSGLGRWILGSVADRVIRHSGSPVLVIRASK